ncbi:MAG TPA: hypothetical protein VK629_20265 [Steroidobacteraceae bacterium]|nr:hypothetical protein [Steroidobacteraceae bacterium]
MANGPHTCGKALEISGELMVIKASAVLTTCVTKREPVGLWMPRHSSIEYIVHLKKTQVQHSLQQFVHFNHFDVLMSENTAAVTELSRSIVSQRNR